MADKSLLLVVRHLFLLFLRARREYFLSSRQNIYIFFNKAKNIMLVIMSIYMLFSLIFNIKTKKSIYNKNYKG